MVSRRISAVVLAAGMAVVTGCVEDPVQPDTSALESNAKKKVAVEPEAAPPPFVAGSVPAPQHHLVIFKSVGVPADFAASVSALGGTVELAIPAGGAATVSGLTADGVTALRANGSVSSVELEPMIAMPGAQLDAASVEAAAAPASAANPAGAFFFPRQWHLRAIDADDAWAAGNLGSPDVTVAILDTGIGYIHADLAGLVDLSRSISFVPTDDQFVAAFFPGAHPIADIGFHGTHVAATVSSNALAAAGVTSRTTLMGVKVCSVATGGCPGGAIFAGIEHAVANGADIINMSLGGAFLKRTSQGFVSVINRLFNHASQNGVTVIVSAGNESADLDHEIYPNANDVMTHFPSLYKTYCDTPSNICVSATGPTARASVNGPWQNIDAPASYTNFGSSAINVAAPGGNGSSTVTAACSPFSLLQGLTICQTGTFVVGSNGTSMAAPHVTGLAAMIMGQQGKLSPSQVKALLQQSADDLGASGTDPYYGKGRINAARAVGAQ